MSLSLVVAPLDEPVLGGKWAVQWGGGGEGCSHSVFIREETTRTTIGFPTRNNLTTGQNIPPYR